MKKKFLLLGLAATLIGGCGPISMSILGIGTEALLLEEIFKI